MPSDDYEYTDRPQVQPIQRSNRRRNYRDPADFLPITKPLPTEIVAMGVDFSNPTKPRATFSTRDGRSLKFNIDEAFPYWCHAILPDGTEFHLEIAQYDPSTFEADFTDSEPESDVPSILGMGMGYAGDDIFVLRADGTLAVRDSVDLDGLVEPSEPLRVQDHGTVDEWPDTDPLD